MAGTGEFLSRPAPVPFDRVDPEPVFDVLLNLPARALDTLRGRGLDDQNIIATVVNAGMRCCRIDLAIDCYDKRVHPGLAKAAAESGAYVGRSMNHEFYQSGKKNRKPAPGERMTVTFGARTGAFFFRVYDKAGQIEDVTGGAVTMEHCTRFEMEVKGNREKILNSDGCEVIQPAAAELVAALYVEQGPSCIAGVFAGRINFVDRKSAARVERCKDVWWWKKIVADAEPVVFGLQRGISTPETSLTWLEKSVAPTLAVALRTGEGDRIRSMVQAVTVKKSALEKWQEYCERKKFFSERRREVKEKPAPVVTARGTAAVVPVSEVRPVKTIQLRLPINTYHSF